MLVSCRQREGKYGGTRARTQFVMQLSETRNNVAWACKKPCNTILESIEIHARNQSAITKELGRPEAFQAATANLGAMASMSPEPVAIKGFKNVISADNILDSRKRKRAEADHCGHSTRIATLLDIPAHRSEEAPPPDKEPGLGSGMMRSSRGGLCRPHAQAVH